MTSFTPIIRELGEQDYVNTWHAMQEFTASRQLKTDKIIQDEIWLLQHPPVYTLGLNGKPEHILNTSSIPVVSVDRGGQITYHGPGQLVVYLMIDLNRRNYGVHDFVKRIEFAVINLLDEYNISATGKENAPGVYVDNAKIAALGLRVKKGFTYHGLSLNIAMDLSPFNLINPCGYPGLKVTDMLSLHISDGFYSIQSKLLTQLLKTL